MYTTTTNTSPAYFDGAHCQERAAKATHWLVWYDHSPICAWFITNNPRKTINTTQKLVMLCYQSGTTDFTTAFTTIAYYPLHSPSRVVRYVLESAKVELASPAEVGHAYGHVRSSVHGWRLTAEVVTWLMKKKLPTLSSPTAVSTTFSDLISLFATRSTRACLWQGVCCPQFGTVRSQR